MALVNFASQLFDADLIVFDKDGTLTEFDPLWQAIYGEAVEAVLAGLENRAEVAGELHAALGYDPTIRRFSTHGPFTTAANAKIGVLVAGVLYRHAQPAPSWDEAESLTARTFLAGLAAPPAPGLLIAPTDLPALFGCLRAAGVHIAVITSDERAATLYTLDALGVSDLLCAVIASDDAYPKKPAPDALWAVCAQQGVAVERAVMVGDSLTDMRMGRAAGVGLCVGVLTGPAGREDLAPYADVVIESIGEIGVAGDCGWEDDGNGSDQ